MKKPLICASLACACAFALQAGTNDWFTAIGSTASASSYASVNGTWDTNTYVQAGGEVTWDGTAQKFTFDLEDSEYITFDATSGTSPDTNTVTRVEVSGVFTPVSSELPDNSAMNARSAQVGFVVSTNGASGYTYKAWYGASWVALSNSTLGAPAGNDAETDLIVEFDYSGRDNALKNYVSFYIKSGGTEYPLTDGSATKFEMTSDAGSASNQVAGVSCYGSGTISKADGAVEIGIATLNGKKYPSIGAAVAAASGTAEISVVRPTDEAVTVNKAGITINDPNDIYTGNIAVSGDITTTVKPAAAEFTGVELAGKSGTYTLKAGATDISKVEVQLPMNNKEVKSKALDDGKVQVTIQTAKSVLAAATTDGGKSLSVETAAKETALRTFLNKNAKTAYDAADVSSESIAAALNSTPENQNGLKLWQDYALGIEPETSIKPVTAPAGDASTTDITLSVPSLAGATPSGDYAVSYSVEKVGGSAVGSEQTAGSLKIPVGASASGTYNVKVTLTP